MKGCRDDPAIAVSIAVLGAVLLLWLLLRIRAVDAQLKLKRHRCGDAGLADLLNYAAVVDDGVIVGKNGSFTAAWLYKGEDHGSSTDVQREAVSMRINHALAGLGNGWMLHVDAVRMPAPRYGASGLSHFPDPVSAAIDEERRRLFERLGTMYEGYFILSLTYFPPLLAQRRFVELMFDDDTRAPGHRARTQGLIEHFQRECVAVESRLSSAIELQRMRGQKITQEDGSRVTHDDLLRWLQRCITGLDHPVQLPRNPMYLDALLGGQELLGGVVPKIGRQFIQVVIKPMDVGLETSLIVSTDRRTYHLRLRSHRTAFMPRVGFTYPEEALAKWDALKTRASQEQQQRTLASTGEYLGNLDFAYDIAGAARWKPVRVYNDGRKTIIEMPGAMQQTEAPALLVVRKEGGLLQGDDTVMVNYRVQGDRYIVDSVFDKAVLVAGVGRSQERVTITRGARP